jgi:hypothetical protein
LPVFWWATLPNSKNSISIHRHHFIKGKTQTTPGKPSPRISS